MPEATTGARSGTKLVVVESPHKARTIAGYLGAGYVVESSVGHIRDLPRGAADVPAKYKGESWARLGVNVDDGFEPLYVIPADKKQQVAKLKDLLKGADELFLATDEDREGEAIAWHLLQTLNPKVPVKRMVFHEITPGAIRAAAQHPRQLDDNLVDAQETRRILDRLYGYEVSPVLWKKVMPRLSAGRVQSVATRIIVERERARMAFVSGTYWGIDADFAADARDLDGSAHAGTFAGALVSVDGTRLATGRDFDSATGALKAGLDVILLAEPEARAIAAALPGASARVASVEDKPFTKRPSPPFMTSTLQQEAGYKLHFSSERTMRTAQRLYEGGYITYMRTDSTTLSQTALDSARAQARELYGPEYVPDAPRHYTRKVKNAQEAHEAIRPAGDQFRTPGQVAGALAGDEFRLYELIWRRTIASQMADARGRSVTARIAAAVDVAGARRDLVFSASGQTITFRGYQKAYDDTADDADGGASADRDGDGDGTNGGRSARGRAAAASGGASADGGGAATKAAPAKLPPLAEGQSLVISGATPDGHSTKPPARYTEPSLVKALEEMGIGRPSTYASIIRTITDRGYVWRRGSALVPSWVAFAVIGLMERYFPRLVDYDFTAAMEDELDGIAAGRLHRTDWLSGFYFGGEVGPVGSVGRSGGLKHLVADQLDTIDAREVNSLPLLADAAGRTVVVRVGRFGPYLERPALDPGADGSATERANLPDDLPPDEVTAEVVEGLFDQAAAGDEELGVDPATGHAIVAKDGRYGPYVTEVLPEGTPKTGKNAVKPRTASLFKSMSLATITLDQALQLLTLPRLVGVDPESGAEITAQNGRYGPYLKKGTDSRSLASEEALFTVTLDEALALYSQPKARGRVAAAAPLRQLGVDPNSERPMVVKEGRFGPYVTDGATNASLRKGDNVETLTDARAAELLAEKRAKGPAPARGRRTGAGAGAKTATTRRKSAAKK